MPPQDNPFAAMLMALDHLNARGESDRVERLAFEADLRNTANAMSTRLQMLETRMLEASARLEKVEPVVSMVTSLQAKMTGAILVLGVVGGIAWSGVLFFKDTLLSALK